MERRYRVARLGALGVVLDVAHDGDVGHAEHIGEMAHEHRVFAKVPVGGHRERGAIAHEFVSVTVENASTGSRCGHGPRLVLHGELIVVVRTHHLHAPELHEKRGEHRGDPCRQQGETAFVGKALGIALSFCRARARTVLRVKREAAGIAPHEDEGPHYGGDENEAGYNDEELSTHRCHPYHSLLPRPREADLNRVP